MSGRLKKFFEGIFVWINLSVIIVGAFLVYQFHVPWGSWALEDVSLTSMYSMKPFSTNLWGRPQRYIYMEVSLEVLDKESLKELQELGGILQDTVVDILNGTSFKELETLQGKLRLKNQMTVQINDLLHEGVVQNAYFSQLVVQ